MASPQTIPAVNVDCPYVGLQPYTLADRDYFFGRKRDQEVIFSNLFSARLTVLYGASGVGKSSVLQAGLLPMLQVHRRAVAVYFRDWQSPTFLRDLKGACLRAVQQVRPGLLVSAELPLDELLAAIAEASHRTVYIILDQFEELFLYHPESEAAFDSEFASSVNRDDVNANFLITIRDDAISKLDRFRMRIANLLGNTLRIRHLDPASAEEAIRGPLAVYNQRTADCESNIAVEDALIRAVLAQLRPSSRVVLGDFISGDADRIETPFLQLVLERLWREELQHGSRTMRLETLEGLGNADRIVRTHFDNVMAAFSESDCTLCADLFRFLVTPDRSKVAVSVSALSQLTGVGEPQIHRVMEKLCHGTCRVLRAVAAPEGGSRYEIFHDVLASAILDWRTRRVQEQQRMEAGQLAELAAAKRIEEGKRKVEEAAERERIAARELALCQAEKLAEEQQKRAEDNARSARRLRWLVGALAVGLGLLLISTAIAVHSKQIAKSAATEALNARVNAEEQKQKAVIAAKSARDAEILAENEKILAEQAETRANRLAVVRKLVNASMNSLEVDPERSVLFAINAVSVSSHAENGVADEAMGALHRSLETDRLLRTIPLDSIASSVAFSPDGRRIATANRDGTARIWEATSGRELQVLYGHVGPVTAVAFSRSGAFLATAGSDGKAKVWEAASGRELNTLSGLLAPLTDIKFASENLLATASEDSTVTLWAVPSGERHRTLLGHWGKVEALSVDPTGKRLASLSGSDKRVILWDIATGQVVRRIQTSAEPTAVTFDPSGDQIAVSDVEGNVTTWDAHYGHQLKVTKASSTFIFRSAYSPDGKYFATAAYDGIVRVRDAQTGRPFYTLAGHKNAAVSVAFSPDGSEIVTTGWDQTLRLWSTTPLGYQQAFVESASSAPVNEIVYSSDGRFVAAAKSNGIRVWDAASGVTLKSLKLPAGDFPYSIAFSPDGKKMASAGVKGVAAIWDLASGQQLCSLKGHTEDIHRIAFSPNGRLVVTASSDSTAGIWDSNSCQRLQKLQHEEKVFAAVFSPDGRSVATASKDKTARLWSTSTGKEMVAFKGHYFALLDVAFSPRGDRIVTGSTDNTAKVWDVTSGKEAFTISGHSDSVMAVSFSPDGKQIATGSLDKTIKLWDAASGKELQTVSKGIQEIYALTFSPDGRWLAVAGRNSVPRVYAMRIEDLQKSARLRVTRRLTDQECKENLGNGCPDEVADLVKQGRALSKDFVVSTMRNQPSLALLEQADAKFRRAKALDSTLPFDPDTEAHRAAAALAFEAAQILADEAKSKEDILKVLGLVQLAVKLDATIRLNPESYFRQVAANRLVVEARTAARNGDLKEATADLQEIARWDRTLNLMPDRDARTMVAQAHLLKSLDLFDNGQSPAGISELEQAVQIAPDYTLGHRLLADLYVERKEYEKAIRHLRVAAQAAPDPETAFLLAELHQQLADAGPARNHEESEEAVKLADRSLQEYPDFRCGYLSLGHINYARKEFEKAVVALRQIGETDFCYGDAITFMAEIYFDKKHDYELAYQVYKQGLALHPDSTADIANFAEASLATKRYDNAYALAEQVLHKSASADTSVALAMRFVKICSLAIRGQNELANQALGEFVEFYNREVTPEFQQEWTYTGSENFIRQEESIAAPQRDLLLKLLEVLQTPKAPIKLQDFR